MINQAARVYTLYDEVFVKWKENAPPGFFAAEADGLRRLKAVGAIRVPEVVWVAEAQGDVPAYLALEYIETSSPSDPARFAREFGEGLAALHREGLSPNGQFGLERDNYLGELPQVNAWHEDWAGFLRDCRLLPQIEMARKRRL